MRLLNTHSWEIKDFISDDVPQYAILSHTWGDEEINLQQWEGMVVSDITHKKGYNKIKQFGEKAAGDGFDWVWVDTCCIDKKSSAELSEAINAMFRWYKNAKICYVYLSDVEWCTDLAIMSEQLRGSRWFTRGWTMQELIAPLEVEFYSDDWRKIATKEELCGLLSSITNIDEHILKGGKLNDVGVARRMSWASSRQTSRIEDIAYSLLGIFDVNIPLIYGEGTKAFRRLQEAIMNEGCDQSLFAWGRIVDCPADLIDKKQEIGTNPIPWKAPHERQPLLGLFAESPASFKNSGDIAPVDHGFAHHSSRQRPPAIVNRGVLINLVIYQRLCSVTYWDDLAIAQPHALELAVLLCRFGSKGSKLIGIVLHSWGSGYHSRTEELVLLDLFVSSARFHGWTRQRHILPFEPFPLRNGDMLLRRWVTSIKHSWVERPITDSGPAWRLRCGDRVLRMEKDVVGDEEESFMFKTSKKEGFAVTFKRLAQSTNPIGPLLIGVSPFEAKTMMHRDEGKMPDDWVAKHGKPFHTPAFFHVMENPSDDWEVQIDGNLRMHTKVERMVLDGGKGGAIDVVDLFIHEAPGLTS